MEAFHFSPREARHFPLPAAARALLFSPHPRETQQAPGFASQPLPPPPMAKTFPHVGTTGVCWGAGAGEQRCQSKPWSGAN